MIWIGDIEYAVSLRMGVSVKELRSRKRSERVAFARQVVMYLAYELTNESYPSIGKMMGRDHTTVLYGHRITEARMRANRGFQKLVEGVQMSIAPGMDTEDWQWERRVNYSAQA